MADFDPDAFIQGDVFDPDAFLSDPVDPTGKPIPAMQAASPSITERVGELVDDVRDIGRVASQFNPFLNFFDFAAGSETNVPVATEDGFRIEKRPEETREQALERLGVDEGSITAITGQVLGEVVDPTTLALGALQVPAKLGTLGRVGFGAGQAASQEAAAETLQQLGDTGEISDPNQILQRAALGAVVGGTIQGAFDGAKGLAAVRAEAQAGADNASREVADLAKAKIAEGQDLQTSFRDAASELGYADVKGARARKVALSAAEQVAQSKQGVQELKRVIDEDLYLTGSATGNVARRLTTAASAPIRALDTNGNIARRADQYFGVVSTRINNLSPTTAALFRRHDLNEHIKVGQRQRDVMPFVNSMARLRKTQPSVAKQLDESLANGDLARTVRLLDSAGLAQEDARVVRQLLKDMEGELQEVGLLNEGGGLENFFPRVVKDVEGLKNALGREQQSVLNTRIQEAITANGGKALTEVDISKIVNRVIREGLDSRVQVGTGRASRTLDEISPELSKFYKTSEQSLLDYISYNTRDIESRRFYGRAGIDGTTEEFGDLTGVLVEEGKRLTPDEHDELINLIRARASGAAQASGPLTTHVKNLSYLATVANPMNALVQVADLPLAAYKNGLGPTFRGFTQSIQLSRAMRGLEKLEKTNPESAKAIYKALQTNDLGTAVRIARDNGLNFSPVERSIDIEDFGLVNNIAAEITKDSSALTKAVDKAFEVSGFAKLDRIGKRVHMNASLNKLRGIANLDNAQAAEKLLKKYGEGNADLFDEAIESLRRGDVRNPAVQNLVWHDLLDMQPITLTELPEFYLKYPNMRWAYTLKSFGLKQLDIVRRDVWKEAKAGNVGDATKAALALTAAVTLGTGSYRAAKDLILTGESEDPSSYALDALLGFAFLSKYSLDRLEQGDLSGIVGGTIIPPALDVYGSAIEDTISLAREDKEFEFELGKHLPIVKDVMKAAENQ